MSRQVIEIHRASLVAQLTNLPTMQEIPLWFLVRNIPQRRDRSPTPVFLGFPGGLDGKKSSQNVRDLGSIPGLGRSPGEYGNPLQHSCLENPQGKRSLAGSLGSQRVGYGWATKHSTAQKETLRDDLEEQRIAFERSLCSHRSLPINIYTHQKEISHT